MKTSKHWASEGGAQLCQEGKWHNFPRFKALLRLSERLVLSMFADQPESKHGCLSLSLLTLMPQLCSWTASQICAIMGSSLWFIFCVCIFSHLVDAHGSNLPVSILTVFSICCLLFFCAGKKNGDLDRNFDTLDLPKRSEAAKGNANVCAFGNDK